jgi:hypothetical protein
MTDEAISSAPAAPASEPASAPSASTAAPSQEGPAGKSSSAGTPSRAPKLEASPAAALDRAFDALEFDEDEPSPRNTPKADRARDEAGRFAPTDPNAKPQQAAEQPDQPAPAGNKFAAPERFSADAKAAWELAPEPVKAEVNRAITELTSGIEKYRADFEPYRAFDQQLKANGQNFQEVLGHYTGMEALLARNPVEGLERICNNLGFTLEDVARQILGAPADERGSRDQQTIMALRQELEQVKQGLNGITQAEQQRRLDSAMQQVSDFAAAHPRVDELANDIKFFLETGRATTLDQAYQMADRLNPAPASAAPVQTPAPVQTRQVRASITGAPASGSNPGQRKRSASIDDALNSAFGIAGL